MDREVFDFSSNSSLEYIHVNHIVSVLGLQLAEALPGLHDFTGYDYGPAFSGRGKSRPLKLLQKCEDVPNVVWFP